MEETSVQRLARVLRALVLIAFVCNLLVIPLVPGLAIRAVGAGTDQVFLVFRAMFGLAGVSALESVWQFLTDALWGVWTDRLLSLVTLFLWLCGICTAVILWQAKKVLDTILAQTPFQKTHAPSTGLRCAAGSSPGRHWCAWCCGCGPTEHLPPSLPTPRCSSPPSSWPGSSFR